MRFVDSLCKSLYSMIFFKPFEAIFGLTKGRFDGKQTDGVTEVNKHSNGANFRQVLVYVS